MTPARSKTSRKPTPATPPEPRGDILDLLVRCLSTADNQAWQELLCIIQPLARRTCRLKSEEQRDEFSQWLSGWPRLNSTIGCACKKLRAVLATGPHMSSTDQFNFFKNYFTHVIQSARNDYLKERVPHTMEEPPSSDDHDPSAAPPVEKKRRRGPREIDAGDAMNKIPSTLPSPAEEATTNEEDPPGLAALANLDPSLRVPFLLTLLPDLLNDPDYQWIANQSKHASIQDICQQIEQERALHYDKKHPLPGTFIAHLLGLSPAAVSQRVRRARLALADALNRARS